MYDHERRNRPGRSRNSEYERQNIDNRLPGDNSSYYPTNDRDRYMGSGYHDPFTPVTHHYDDREEHFDRRNEGRDVRNVLRENRPSNEPRNMYGGDTSNYGNLNQGGFDRTWSKIPDMISSWFGGNKHKGKGPKGYHPSEQRIREQVCDRLSDSPTLDASNIEIKVDGSEVILTGTVESRRDKRLAEDLAETVSGVRDIHNQLRIEERE